MSKPTPAPRRRKAHFYWWTLANVLAGCAAVLSWLLCLHVFGHPEIPRNYELLNRLDLNDPAPAFPLQEAPPGEAADPGALYQRYAELHPAAVSRLNNALMRNYLTGLEERALIQYVEGDFEITHVRELDDADLFAPGFVVRARAMIRPDEASEPVPWPVSVDYLFPTRNRAAADWFQPGDLLKITKVPNCATLIHVGRQIEGDLPVVRLTVVPIVMGDYQVGKDRSFGIVAPEALNPAARLPVFPEDATTMPEIEGG